MTAKECIKGRRSIRKFTEQPIDHSLLEGIIETASYSPSWKNTQIVRYIAVEGVDFAQHALDPQRAGRGGCRVSGLCAWPEKLHRHGPPLTCRPSGALRRRPLLIAL